MYLYCYILLVWTKFGNLQTGSLRLILKTHIDQQWTVVIGARQQLQFHLSCVPYFDTNEKYSCRDLYSENLTYMSVFRFVRKSRTYLHHYSDTFNQVV